MDNYGFPGQLQRTFEADIVEGAISRNQSFSVASLRTRYQTNQQDLFKVLASAKRKGLIEINPDGSIMILGKNQPSITSIFQHTAQSGLSPTSVVRSVEVILASAQVAQVLKISEGDPVFCQVRTRLVNGEVIANQKNYIPIEVSPGLETIDLSHTSFQETLDKHFNAVVCDIEEFFEIRFGDMDDISVLGLEDGAGILVVQRLSLSSSHLPLVWADIHIRTDRYLYVKALWPEASALLDGTGGLA